MVRGRRAGGGGTPPFHGYAVLAGWEAGTPCNGRLGRLGSMQCPAGKPGLHANFFGFYWDKGGRGERGCNFAGVNEKIILSFYGRKN